jgi:murein DD-endopeptidase MepM/ murein hydrolase activator NlpD
MSRTTYWQAGRNLKVLKRWIGWKRAGHYFLLPLLAALLCSFGTNSGHSGSGSARKMLKVTTRDEGGITHFMVQNLDAADVTATFNVRLFNLKGSTNFPYTTTFRGNETVDAFTLSPVKPDARWHYIFSDDFTVGNSTAVPDGSYIYSLPYAPGTACRVTQGYHGRFSHTGADEYAIDWQMAVGTPVYAARGGVVVGAKGDSDVGGPDRKYESSANYILIQHADGTIGIYAHLMKDGTRVKLGAKVEAGQWIGLSGDTGFTSGPHLHFSVFMAKNGRERLSVPVKFKTSTSPALTIVSGESYQAASIAVQQAAASPARVGMGGGSRITK